MKTENILFTGTHPYLVLEAAYRVDDHWLSERFVTPMYKRPGIVYDALRWLEKNGMTYEEGGEDKAARVLWQEIFELEQFSREMALDGTDLGMSCIGELENFMGGEEYKIFASFILGPSDSPLPETGQV